MATLLQQYHAASATDLQPVLNAIVNAGPFTFDAASRTELIQSLLSDLKNKNRISAKDNALALLAVKTLGKNPTGSETLGTAPNLTILLGLVASLKDDPEASGEALRCIANALLLIENARKVFISKEVNGGETCMSQFEKSSNPDQIFILSRILFLATVHPSAFITNLVEEKRHGSTVVYVIGSKLDLLLVSLLSGAKMAKEAMVDVLKFTFNILMHYPKSLENGDATKVIGDNWSPKLDPILPPLLRVFHALPPTFPAPVAAPLTHVIHSLITIPVSPALRAEWFAASPRSSGSSSPNRKHVPAPGPPIVIPPSPRRADSSSSTSSRTHSPVRSGTPTSPTPKSSTLDRALSVLTAGRRSLSRSPSPVPPAASASSSSSSAASANGANKLPADTLLRAHALLEVAFAHYFPDATEADDPAVRELAKAEAGPNAGPDALDDELSPLVVLITRLCIADEGSRVRTRDWVCPPDLDRSAAAGALEGRPDLLGRCLRLLGSVYHARLKDSVGEMLFVICDSDATTMSTLFGYGNVAGFLFNKGIMNAPPPPSASSTTPAGLAAAAAENINPITGTAQEAREPVPEMTEEEKEREMEKLFVVFDRLERRGEIAPESNPIRQAIRKAAMGGGPPPKEEDDD
ncbi:guanine nucleotide exchange factor [Mycena alexandri]|uniref:Guanine nucleotide exchange factor n=1 Tax=Mycena alexandri TaxID=1745969 RepID=A0AAD6XH69_9AGAR|nr:guanine nucleotide exchange factor [Mycena alexandri]